MAELMNTCHPLNVVLGSGIPRGFCSWPVCLRVITIICEEWCYFYSGMEGVVVGIFWHRQHFFPIIRFIITVVSETVFQCLVHTFHLSVGLRMTGWWAFVLVESGVQVRSGCWGSICSSLGVSSGGGAPSTLTMSRSLIDSLLLAI